MSFLEDVCCKIFSYPSITYFLYLISIVQYIWLLEIICGRWHIELNQVEEESEKDDLILSNWVLSCVICGKLETYFNVTWTLN